MPSPPLQSSPLFPLHLPCATLFRGTHIEEALRLSWLMVLQGPNIILVVLLLASIKVCLPFVYFPSADLLYLLSTHSPMERARPVWPLQLPSPHPWGIERGIQVDQCCCVNFPPAIARVSQTRGIALYIFVILEILEGRLS